MQPTKVVLHQKLATVNVLPLKSFIVDGFQSLFPIYLSYGDAMADAGMHKGVHFQDSLLNVVEADYRSSCVSNHDLTLLTQKINTALLLF